MLPTRACRNSNGADNEALFLAQYQTTLPVRHAVAAVLLYFEYSKVASALGVCVCVCVVISGAAECVQIPCRGTACHFKAPDQVLLVFNLVKSLGLAHVARCVVVEVREEGGNLALQLFLLRHILRCRG